MSSLSQKQHLMNLWIDAIITNAGQSPSSDRDAYERLKAVVSTEEAKALMENISGFGEEKEDEEKLDQLRRKLVEAVCEEATKKLQRN